MTESQARSPLLFETPVMLNIIISENFVLLISANFS